MTDEDAVKREAVLNTLDTMDKALDENRTVEAYKELLAECFKALPTAVPKPTECEDCVSRKSLLSKLDACYKEKKGIVPDNLAEGFMQVEKLIKTEPPVTPKSLDSVLDDIKSEIGVYEADCRLQGGTDECEKCNSNVFGSIYRIIDKYKGEST